MRWPYLTPLLAALGVWVYGPLVATVVLSLTEWDLGFDEARFVGLANYGRLFTEPEFPNALGRTGLYVVGLLPFATVVPMALAIRLWKRPGRASDAYRALLVLPITLAPLATAVSWRFILDPVQGVANAALGAVGLPQPYWLGDPATALPVLVVVSASRVVALHTLLYGAALAQLDRRALDAARLDGASEGEVTRRLIVPQLVPTTVLLALLCVVLSGQWVFTNIAVLTQGGPDATTDSVYYRLYTYGFVFFDVGTASAGAVVLTVGLALAFGLRSLVTRRRHAPS